MSSVRTFVTRLPISLTTSFKSTTTGTATCRRPNANSWRVRFDARRAADRLSREQGLVLVHPYDDPAVIAAANQAGIAMLFTGVRHFRH